MKRIGSSRHKTRSKFKKNIRNKGKISLTKYLQTFKIGDNVALVAEPAVQKAIYFQRFHGKIGKIKAKRGSCYEVSIKNGSKEKIIITHPIHLKKIK
jgi:large subunit ribosomal protein L21e